MWLQSIAAVEHKPCWPGSTNNAKIFQLFQIPTIRFASGIPPPPLRVFISFMFNPFDDLLVVFVVFYQLKHLRRREKYKIFLPPGWNNIWCALGDNGEVEWSSVGCEFLTCNRPHCRRTEYHARKIPVAVFTRRASGQLQRVRGWVSGR